MTAAALFVYGTLRTGGALEGWLGRRHRKPYTLEGFSLFWPPSHTSFPALVPMPSRLEQYSVVGEVVPFDPWGHDATLVRMEVMAGYDLRWVTPTILSFVWPDCEPVGDHIGSDFLAAATSDMEGFRR